MIQLNYIPQKGPKMASHTLLHCFLNPKLNFQIPNEKFHFVGKKIFVDEPTIIFCSIPIGQA